MDFSDISDYINKLISPEQVEQEYIDPREYKKQQTEEFLKKMSAIESSSGKNTKHKKITNPNSVHYGTAAIGQYGIMPLTALEMAKRFNIEELKGMDKFEAEDYLNKNPEMAEKIAKSMASWLNAKRGEGELANYMWQYGHQQHLLFLSFA